MPDEDFTSPGLIGFLISTGLLAKLVDAKLISPADAAELADVALLQLEQRQSLFPDQKSAFRSRPRGPATSSPNDWLPARWRPATQR